MSDSFIIKETLTIETGSPPTATPIFMVGPCSSSIDVAWELIARDELPLWGTVLVESQTGGRGRMGRVWQSPPGHVYGAVRLPLAPPFDGPGASLALALILAEVLRDFGWEMQIKWPNDLIYDGGKVGGLLLESREIKMAGRRCVFRSAEPLEHPRGDGGVKPLRGLVAGIGFNLLAPPEGDWRREREPGAPVPSALPFADGPAALWPALVKRFVLLYKEKFRGRTMPELIPEAERRMFWLGRRVAVVRPSSTPPAPETGLVGRIAGLGPDGYLRLTSADGEFSLWSGTVCLRPD